MEEEREEAPTAPPSLPSANSNQEILDAEIVDDDPEPPKFCRAHMPYGTSDPCGPCKIAREINEAWSQRQASRRMAHFFAERDQRKRQRRRCDRQPPAAAPAPVMDAEIQSPEDQPAIDDGCRTAALAGYGQFSCTATPVARFVAPVDDFETVRERQLADLERWMSTRPDDNDDDDAKTRDVS